MSRRASDVDGRPRLKKIYIRFGTWSARSLYRAGSLINSVAFSPLANYTAERPPLIGEVSANFLVAPNQQANIHFSMERVMRIIN
jgi:hypothetical protein